MHSLLANNFADLLGSAIKVLIVKDIEFFLLTGDHLLGDIGVGALEAEDHRLGERVLLVGLDDRASEVVTTKDTTENVHKDGFYFGIFVEEFESFGKLLAFGAAADIQEIGGLTTVELNDIHGGHGESGTVDEAADVTTDMDVVQVEVFGMLLTWVVLSLIFLSSKILLSE